MREFGFLACTFLFACGGATPTARPRAVAECKPLPVEVRLAAGDALNGASSAEARPVQVRIYQLRGEGRLQAATFEDVWQRDKKTLADDLVSVQETTSYPGAESMVSVAPKDGAEFVAIVALFREPEDPNWFVLHALPTKTAKPPCPKGPMRVSLQLDRMQIAEGGGGQTGSS